MLNHGELACIIIASVYDMTVCIRILNVTKYVLALFASPNPVQYFIFKYAT